MHSLQTLKGQRYDQSCHILDMGGSFARGIVCMQWTFLATFGIPTQLASICQTSTVSENALNVGFAFPMIGKANDAAHAEDSLRLQDTTRASWRNGIPAELPTCQTCAQLINKCSAASQIAPKPFTMERHSSRLDFGVS